MKTLVLLGGPPGVGKTSVLHYLENNIPACGILDADDVWRVSSDIAVEQNRTIAHANVISAADGYLVAGCQTVIVSWVFARAALYEPLIHGLQNKIDQIKQIYLTADPETLSSRIRERRSKAAKAYPQSVEELIDYSLDRQALIASLPFQKIDTSHLSSEEVGRTLLSLLESKIV